MTRATNEGDPTAMTIVVTGVLGGDPVTCDSNAVAACTLDSGSAFAVALVPDTIPQGGYSFWATHLNYGTLMYQTRDLSEEITWDLSFFPKRAPESAELDWVAHGDVSDFFPPFPRSDQKTALVTLDFNCNTSDTLSMIGFDASPDGSVFGGESADDIFIPEVSAMDIACTEPATPTPCAPIECTSMSLRITGEFEGDGVVCDSKEVDACTLDRNSSFIVEIVPNKIPQAGYAVWQTELEYGALLYRPRDINDEITWDTAFLPFRDPYDPDGREGRVLHTDLPPFFFPLPLSTQTATLVTLDFECGVGDTLKLVASNDDLGGTLLGDNETIYIPKLGEIEVFCGGPTVTPTAVPPTDTPPAPTATPSADCGDIDKNGAVDSRDALVLLQIDSGLVALPAVLPPPHWDVNVDGAVDARDAALILQFEAGLLATLTC